MKSLAERHIARAQRKADNKAESTNSGYGGNVGSAAVAIVTVQDAFAALSDEQREELKATFGESDGFMSVKADAYGDAFDGEGSLRNAGIGVVNPLVAPVMAATAIERASDGFGAGGDASGWGKAAESTIANGENAGGKALEEQGGGSEGGSEGGSGGSGWGDPAPKPPVNVKMTVAELEAIAKEEEVDLSGATNNEGRVAAIEAKRKPN